MGQAIGQQKQLQEPSTNDVKSNKNLLSYITLENGNIYY
jgi:hypothetical protein